MALWSNTDEENSKPKNLSNAEKALTLGVSVIEATQSVNIAKGVNTPGWVRFTTYTDSQSTVRNKSEVLVAFSSITGDSTTDDLAPELTITVQPASISVVEPATATFSVTATRTGTGTITFQWSVAQAATPSVFVPIAGATSASFTTAATTVAGDNGDVYRVVVSVPGADSKTSNAAVLTVTAP